MAEETSKRPTKEDWDQWLEEARAISNRPDVQAHYIECRSPPNNCNEKLARIFALRQPPNTVGTDRAFMEGSHTDETDMTRVLRGIAEAQGVSTAGKRFVGSRARWPGDPRAWVSSLDDVRRIDREDADPAWEPEEVPDNFIAPHIVDEHVERRAAHDPDLAAKPIDEQREIVKESLQPDTD